MRALGSTAIFLFSLLSSTLAQTQITVNATSLLQEIDGFGVSQAFTRAKEFYEAAEGPRQRGLDYLFNTETGAGLTIIRNRIGSTANDSILPRSPGSPNGTPNYVWDGGDSSDSYQVWFSKQAMKYGVKTIYGNAWSAPGYMKTNNNEANGGWLCGVTGRSCQSGDWRQAYANLIVQYVKFYAQEGIPVTHVGFLNEPDYVYVFSLILESDGNQAASFIPILHKALADADLGHVGITCCDSIGWPGQRTMTSQLVAQGMERYLSTITSHMYTGDPNSPMNTRLKTWQTEGCDLQSRWCTTWYANGGLCEGMTWANKLHTGMVNANLSAYIYWQGFEVNQFQAASYLVASDNRDVFPSGRLWAFAQWSRFVRPGARRVATSGSVGNVGIGAFKNTDESIAIVFTSNNGGTQNVRVAFQSYTATSAVAFVTDNSRAVAPLNVTLSGGQVTVAVPPRSVVTVHINKVAGPAPNPNPEPTTPTLPPTTTPPAPTQSTCTCI
ncbi:xylanase [Coprinopsis cinerea okayama7|uniref:Xylanase n=1 Tax=Coprinopsis cinerea (strain Okayama-7 / 130 / ATCC MYA-4618 / FGSC 9003) TaxID=240176 RepID=A8NHV9_COPC7|nr:xylanase [Coprinopsis cinerea okayama7\|eukprot:XP_001833839.2 xylanase [Coprinopsis cinerea okayama7\